MHNIKETNKEPDGSLKMSSFNIWPLPEVFCICNLSFIRNEQSRITQSAAAASRIPMNLFKGKANWTTLDVAFWPTGQPLLQ